MVKKKQTLSSRKVVCTSTAVQKKQKTGKFAAVIFFYVSHCAILRFTDLCCDREVSVVDRGPKLWHDKIFLMMIANKLVHQKWSLVNDYPNDYFHLAPFFNYFFSLSSAATYNFIRFDGSFTENQRLAADFFDFHAARLKLNCALTNF